jgi:iron-sulfur cluster repair protein YtfE (RIC family)
MRANLTTERLPDFDHPLEALKACHEHIEEQVQSLYELAAHLRTHGSDEYAQRTAANLMNYFDTVGRLHYEDEERDVFPSLRAAALGLNVGRVALLMRQVEQQHRAMELAWKPIKGAISRIARGESTPINEAGLDRFVRSCRAHIALTKSKLFPLAMLLLTEPELMAIGRSMARRRGVQPRPSLRTFEVAG